MAKEKSKRCAIKERDIVILIIDVKMYFVFYIVFLCFSVDLVALSIN